MGRGLERVAYVIVGDVAVISVKGEELEEYRVKALEVMRRHPRLKAVYAKLETTGEFRVQRLVLLAGKPVDVTWHRENGLWFRVSIGKVYVNPRLSTEHLLVARLAEELGARRVLDAFSGVGGYSIHTAVYSKTTRLVVANDANPYAIADLLASLYRNRRRLEAEVHALNMDASRLPSVLRSGFDLIILDLPHQSVEYASLCKLGAAEHHLIFYRVWGENTKDLDTEVLRALERVECGECRVEGVRRVVDYSPRRYIYRVLVHCRQRTSA